mmetsp:Transcript_16663/g.29894  ORF Transcript_16663/g.29894 Transcript_16663/m.29894 type:complete len:183 (-) Transcript_16663:258-806(-)
MLLFHHSIVNTNEGVYGFIENTALATSYLVRIIKHSAQQVQQFISQHSSKQQGWFVMPNTWHHEKYDNTGRLYLFRKRPSRWPSQQKQHFCGQKLSTKQGQQNPTGVQHTMSQKSLQHVSFGGSWSYTSIHISRNTHPKHPTTQAATFTSFEHSNRPPLHLLWPMSTAGAMIWSSGGMLSIP